MFGTKDKMRWPRIPCFRIPVSDGRKLTKSRNAKNRLQSDIACLLASSQYYGRTQLAMEGNSRPNSEIGQWLC